MKGGANRVLFELESIHYIKIGNEYVFSQVS